MDRHQLFKLDIPLSLVGLEVDDWVVFLGGWTLALQIAALIFSPRPRLLVATLVAGFGFLLYRRLKDRVPTRFLRHLMIYLNEADTYRAIADTHNVPPVVGMSATVLEGGPVDEPLA